LSQNNETFDPESSKFFKVDSESIQDLVESESES